MKQARLNKLILYPLIATMLVLVAYRTADAGNKPMMPMPPPATSQDQHQKQHQGQAQTVNVNLGTDGTPLMQDSGVTTLSTGATTLDAGDTSFNTSNQSTNVVLVPNNNTESCLRVWGIMFGNNTASGGLGIPTRSAACDFEQAGDDAAAMGDHNLAWFWRCHKRSLYKPYKDRGERKDIAILDCFNHMTDFINAKTLGSINEQLRSDIDQLRDELRQCQEGTRRCTEAYKEELMK